MTLTIKANMISTNSDKLESRGNLPVLIRRLIKESLPASSVISIDFPGNENIGKPGVDGVLECTMGHAYVPEGKSVWEVSADKDIQRKAERDFQKRKALADKDTAFVFVTSRNWNGKNDWINGKEDSEWKGVSAIDANDLEQWLEMCPVTCVWLSEQMGVSQNNLETSEKFLGNWLNSTTPSFSAQALLHGEGRKIQKDRLALFLNSKNAGEDFAVCADTRNEAIAFTCAVIQEIKSENDPNIIISNAEGISETRSWSSAFEVPPTLIVKSRELAAMIPHDLARKCMIIIAGTRGDFAKQKINNDIEEYRSRRITLPRVPDFDIVFKEHQVSRTLYKQTGGSLSVLHRRKTTHQAEMQASWADKIASDKKYIWLALLGRWNESYEPDKKLIVEIAGLQSYAEWEDFIKNLANDEETPLEKTSGSEKGYRLFSRHDVFFAAKENMTKHDIEKFLYHAAIVLREEDPNYRQPNDEKEMYKPVVPRKYSDFLRSGIVDGIILLSLEKESIEYENFQGRMKRFFDTIFSPEKSWHSMHDALPGLAEASPEYFLTQIEDTLRSSPQKIGDLFAPRKSFFHDNYDHPPLLWALEMLAWNPDSLERVVKILCDLQAQFEELIGNFGNKPSRSLHSIFRSWSPQTAAKIELRIKVLENVYQMHPQEILKLALELADAGDQTGDYTFTPMWRDDALKAEKVTHSDRIKMIEKAIQIAIVGLQNDSLAIGARFDIAIKAMRNFDYWYDGQIENATDAICNLPLEEHNLSRKMSEQARSLLAHRIKRNVNRNDDDERVFVAEMLRKIKDKFLSGNPAIDNAYLFSDWPNDEKLEVFLVDGVSKWEEKVDEARSAALQEIYADLGIQGLLTLVAESENSFEVAMKIFINFISKNDFETEEYVFALLKSNIEEGKIQRHVSHLFGWTKNDMGNTPNAMEANDVISIVNNVIARVQDKGGVNNWAEKKIFLLHAIRIDQKEAREYIDNLPVETQKLYFGRYRFDKYMECRPEKQEGGNIINFPDENRWLAQKYIEYKQPALGWNAFRVHDRIPFDMKLALLDAMLIEGRDEGADNALRMRGFDIQEFLNEAATIKLSEEEEAKIQRIEFRFFPVLQHTREDGVSFIQRGMEKNPNIFIDVIRFLYKADDGVEDVVSSDRKVVEFHAEISSYILHHLNFRSRNFSWILEDGMLDGSKFVAWINKVRELAIHAKRRDITDYTLGQILGRSYNPNGEIYPENVICDILEQINNNEIYKGYRTGRYNSRGVISSGVDNKGFTTAELASAYAGAALIMRDRNYFFVAKLMEELADSYRNEDAVNKNEWEKRDLDWR